MSVYYITLTRLVTMETMNNQISYSTKIDIKRIFFQKGLSKPESVFGHWFAVTIHW